MSIATSLIRSQHGLIGIDDSPLGLDEYQTFTTTTDKNKNDGVSGLGFVLLGLFGEVGSLLSELKKKQRDEDSYIAYRDAVIEELGDVLWYFSNGALRAGVTLTTIADKLPAKLDDWDYHGRRSPKAFVDLQQKEKKFDGPLTSDNVERRLMTVAGTIGEIIKNFSIGKFDNNRDAYTADLVEMFRAIVSAADDAEVSLDEAACRNIEKTLSRWPTERTWGANYDDEYDEDEQLPRLIEMTFKEKYSNGKPFVIQKCNGINIGDRLTDNRTQPDDYRFHDVFHLAYAAILGWSPVTRALFRVKRKSTPEIDENQDGARAILIEEGISTWIFNHGMQNQLFRNVDTLDYSLLKAIQKLVAGYEVENRPLWQWQHAIFEGFRIFREVRQKRGGTVIANLNDHTICYSEEL